MSSFQELSNTMVITLKDILNGSKPVLYVSHDEDDGMWQFLDGSEMIDTDNATMVSLEEIRHLDSSLDEIGDLPLGWMAERRDENSVWVRKEIK